MDWPSRRRAVARAPCPPRSERRSAAFSLKPFGPAPCTAGYEARGAPERHAVLRDLGLVEERQMRGQAGRKLWFLLPAGRELLAETGMGGPREA